MEKKVSKFLTVSDIAGVVAVGTTLYNLTTGALNIADGEVGVFDYDTKVAVDASTIVNSKKVFLAVGRDLDGDTVVESIDQSLPVDVNRVDDVEYQDYVAGVAQVKDFAWETTSCETEYCMQFTLESPEISEYMGFNPLRKTFTVTTGCCDDDCATCGGGSCTSLANELVDLINADPDALVTASLVAPADFTGTIVIIAANTIEFTDALGNAVSVASTAFADSASGAEDLESQIDAAMVAAGTGGFPKVTWNSTANFTVEIFNTNGLAYDIQSIVLTAGAVDACPYISLATNFSTVADFCHLPINMVKTNGVNLEVLGLCGFDCNYTISESTELVYEMNSGIVLKDQEEEATGFGTDLMYRYTSLLRPNDSRTLYIDSSVNYFTAVIGHIDNHVGAPSGHRFDSELLTIVAIPTGTTTTETQLRAILDVL